MYCQLYFIPVIKLLSEHEFELELSKFEEEMGVLKIESHQRSSCVAKVVSMATW